MQYVGIYLLFGIIPAIILANKNYDKWKKSYYPSMYEVRYAWIAKSIHSIIYGLSFMIALVLWPLSLIEIIWEKIK